MKNKILSSIILVILIFTVVSNIVYAIDDNTTNTDLPSSYDLRNKINIRVENQGQRGWCSAFATTKTIETNILLTRGIDYNLSEAYLSYSEAEYFGGDVKWKTDIITARALVCNVLTGKGVLESEIPNKDYEFNETNKNKFKNAQITVKSYDYDVFDTDDKIIKIKNHVMNNGGVYLPIDSNEKWYNSNTNAIYSNAKQESKDTELETREQVLKYVEETSDHAVTIIGWNDNYSKDNFKSSCRPQNDGAWLILNSWGTQWGNNGTAWVSYEDVNFLRKLEFGVKNTRIIGDPPVIDFSYSQRNGYVQAVIKSDEELKDIEGWEASEDKKVFMKTFNEKVIPYTLTVYSKLDNSTVAVDIKITNADFKVYDTNSTIHIEGKNKLNSKDLKLIIKVLIAIFIIALFILKHSKKKRKN